MPRDLSPIIEAILATKSQPVWCAVDITLPTAEVIRAAEIELEVTSVNLHGVSVPVDSVIYPALLKQEPTIKFTRTKAPSGGELTLYDINHQISPFAAQIESILENSKVVITTCWEKADGTFEADVYFIGIVRDVSAEDTEIKFNVISDTDSRTAIVAGRSLTQRCLAIYGDDKCRRPAALIAAETGPGAGVCSNIFDDAELGCLSKRWQFAFWGVPILKLSENFATYGGWEPGSGGPTGGGPTGGGGCPSIENFIGVIDFRDELVAMKVKQLEAGMIIEDALDRRAVVESVNFFYEKDMLYIECADGSGTECSFSEPINVDIFDADGVRADELKLDDEILTYDIETRKNARSKIVKIEKIAGRQCALISLRSSSAALYLSGVGKRRMVSRHNKAPIDVIYS